MSGDPSLPPTGSAADPLVVPAPSLGHEAAARIAEKSFGIRGRISDLGGERDQNLRIDTSEGRGYILKVSNPADGPEVLDLQAKALRHLAQHDPELPVMRVVPSLSGSDWVSTAAPGGADHLVRIFTRVPGRTRAAEDLDPTALRAYGTVVARMARALRGFFHPAARYEILWDLRHTSRLRPMLEAVPAGRRRADAERVLDRFDERVAPSFDGLRAQVLHNDLTLDNVLLGTDGRVSGVVDVGDLTHTALVGDLAIALAGVMWRRPDPIQAAQATIAGYVSVVPLEDDEARLLADLVTARLAAWGVIAAWRADRHPDNAAYITSGEDDAWELLSHLESLGSEVVSQQLRTAALTADVGYRPAATSELATRRSAVLGSSPLAYRDPVHLVAGDGVWLFDPDGRRYLDAYNNVPVVGHAHPRVSAAISGQARTLATNTRYLHEAVVTLAERLVSTMPTDLDTVLLVNSGSEANDLAWRLATAATGRRGAITSTNAYHGLTEATAALSPEVWPDGYRPAHVETVPPPLTGSAGGSSGARAVGQAVTDAVAALDARGLGLAAMIIDPAFTSDGILAPPVDELRRMADAVRGAGGLLIIDEVQAGHGRCGSHLWSFSATGISPDVVTLGKPMGNGHPVAAVVTRSDIAAVLMGRTELFSTFGGNPVSCVAALAVLDVIETEDLLRRCVSVGEHLRHELRALAAEHDVLGEIRGSGLLIGVELLREPGSAVAATDHQTSAVVDGLRHRGVLVGSTGRHGNVLKIRPPLVFESAHADLLVETLDEVLGEL